MTQTRPSDTPAPDRAGGGWLWLDLFVLIVLQPVLLLAGIWALSAEPAPMGQGLAAPLSLPVFWAGGALLWLVFIENLFSWGMGRGRRVRLFMIKLFLSGAVGIIGFAAAYRHLGMTHFENGPTNSVGDALYLSAVTWSTVGYGDVMPLTGEARAFAAAEGLLGYLYMGVIAGLAVAQAARRRH